MGAWWLYGFDATAHNDNTVGSHHNGTSPEVKEQQNRIWAQRGEKKERVRICLTHELGESSDGHFARTADELQ